MVNWICSVLIETKSACKIKKNANNYLLMNDIKINNVLIYIVFINKSIIVKMNSKSLVQSIRPSFYCYASCLIVMYLFFNNKFFNVLMHFELLYRSVPA